MDEHQLRDLRDIAFPKLDEAQMASLARCPYTSLKPYRDGDTLFKTGDRDSNFYVVKSGKVEVVDDSEQPPKTLAVHGPGEFTGEVTQLSGGPAVATAVARGDTEAFEVTHDALRQILNLHPALSDVILRAFLARHELLTLTGSTVGPRVIGSRYSKDTFRIREFLSKNHVPYTWLDLEADPRVSEVLKRFGLSEQDTPVVTWGSKLLLRNPSNRELADALGIRRPVEKTTYDLIVVGAGPAGLAAAVYGASEGLNTLVFERTGPGGQAGRSMRIENYLGFATGITGAELAERAVVQANKFGAHMPVPTPVVRLTFDNAYSIVQLDTGETVAGKCVLIATGVDYRKLPVEGCDEFEGRGVYYAATPTEAVVCRGSDVVVVGGGNSAGQAAVYLSGVAHKVYLVIRHDNFYKDMSAYLAQRVEQTPNIEVLKNSEVRRLSGDGHLSDVEIVNTKTGEVRKIHCAGLFSFIGATPRSDWLPPEIERDDKQFVRTGPSLAQSPKWTAKRQPFLLETSRPGVFAAGDVRAGSIKRVASAVGEGSMAVQFVHEYMKEM